MGCIQSRSAGTKEESRRLTKNSSRGNTVNRNAPDFARISAHAPTEGPISQDDYLDRLEYSPTQNVRCGGFSLEFAYVTQRGFYPGSPPDKPNQDAVYVKSKFGDNPNHHFFAVFDGHGGHGEDISRFAKYKVPQHLLEFPQYDTRTAEALEHAMVWTNDQLHVSPEEDRMSGTTAIACLFLEETLWVANVGDSRAIAVSRYRDGSLQADALSEDQTPFRQDELDRVREAGAVVLTLDQMEGSKPREKQEWDEEVDGGDPPRLWLPNAMLPGTAFTRSIGDSLAEEIGVYAKPEVRSLRITKEHKYIVLASDGVFEFLTNDMVAELVSQHEDPQDGAMALVVEAYQHWLQYETRTDDITAIVIQIKHHAPEPSAPTPALMMTTGSIHPSMATALATTQDISTGSHDNLSSSHENLAGLTNRTKSTLQELLAREPSFKPKPTHHLASLKSTRLRDVVELENESLGRLKPSPSAPLSSIASAENTASGMPSLGSRQSL